MTESVFTGNVCGYCGATLRICQHFDWCPTLESSQLQGGDMRSDNLVRRLRDTDEQVTIGLKHAAADAIEARDAEIVDQTNIIRSLLDHKAHLNAEIERLRADLAVVAEHWPGRWTMAAGDPHCCGCEDSRWPCDEILAVVDSAQSMDHHEENNE